MNYGAIQQIASDSNVLLMVFDHDGIVVAANSAISRLLGLPEETIIGSSWIDTFIPDSQRERARRHLQQLQISPYITASEFEGKIAAADGTATTLRWHCVRMHDEQGHPVNVICLGTDVTDWHRNSRLLMQNPNPVLSLTRTGDVSLANSSAQALIEVIATASGNEIADWKAMTQRAVSATDGFSHKLHCGGSTYFFIGTPREFGIDLYGMDVTGQEALKSQLDAIANNLPAALWDYRTHPDGSESIKYMSPGCERVWELSFESIQGDPSPLWQRVLAEDALELRQSILESARSMTRWQHEYRIQTRSGALKWLRGTANPEMLADGTIRWLSIVTDISEIKAAQRTAEKALNDIIRVLAATLEARDPYTAGHEARVASISKQIGERLGFDSHRLRGLEIAAQVHDVGKIQIPAEILTKPGRLSEIEMALVKLHPGAGAKLLEGIDFEWPIAAVIHQHHERFDGSGYPDGLKGEEILIEARIIGVADTLEAMASHRPYRPGKGLGAAAKEIRDGAGSRYDPEVAAACLQLIDSDELVL